MPVHCSKMTTRSPLALVVIIMGLMLFSTISPLAAASATVPSPASVRTMAVSPIQQFALTEWAVPTTSSRPYGIGVDTNGNVWFTENSTNKIGRFDPTNDNFTEWTLPTANSQPRNVYVALFTSGNTSTTEIFFSEFASSRIAMYNPSTNNLTEWALLPNSNPAGIYVDPQNNVWFAESGRDAIGRLIPSTGQLTEWILPGASSSPGSPTLEPWSVYVQFVQRPSYTNQFVWFTERLGDAIGRLETTSNRLTIWNLGSLGLGTYQPNDLTISIYQTLPVIVFTNANNNKISVLGNDTGGGSLYQESVLPTLGAGAMGVTFDAARNATWFAENSVGNIANLNNTNVLAGQLLTPSYCTILPLTGSPACASPATTQARNITSSVTTPVATSELVSPASTGTVTIHSGPIGGVTEYSLPNVESRPAYVAVDSLGNVWFTENNVTANRIGRLSIPYVFQLSASPSVQSIHPGGTATFFLTVSITSGPPQLVQLSLLTTPTGVTASFSPQSQNPPFVSTLILTTTNSTPTGTFPMTVQAASGHQTQTAVITLNVGAVPPPAFDFSVSVAAPTTESVTQGQATSFNILVTLVSGSPQPVSLAASGLPMGVSYSFTNSTGNPSFSTTLNLYTSLNTPGGTYPITITGTGSAGLSHTASVTPVLTVTELPRDFNLSTTVTQVVLVQSSKTDITLTVSSIGYFNGTVALSGTFSPSSGLTVAFTPQTVLLQSSGAVAQATMVITAPKNTVGAYQLTVTASSSNPARTHQVTISLNVSPCLIATATYGSALAPQVQFLRNFRDRQIMNTFAGSNFMTAFNAWYYSFSPAVAQYESQSPATRAVARVILTPLMPILHLSEVTFVAFGLASEVGALAAGLLAGLLIGLSYLALPVSCMLWPFRRKMSLAARGRIGKIFACMFALLLAGFAVAELLQIPALMMLSSAGLVLAAALVGSILPAVLVAEIKLKR